MLKQNTASKFDIWLVLIGKLDALLSIYKYYNECKTNGLPICFSSINTNKLETLKPSFLRVEHLWHPCLAELNPVFNSLELGENWKSNMILTGPNAGGKSTIIKAIGINICLSNAYGIAHASLFHHTDYKLICTGGYN